MVIMTRKRYEEELEKVAQKARVEEWRIQRLDDLSSDIGDVQEKIKELECKTVSSHDDIRVLWNRIDQIQNELSRIPKCN